MRRIPDERRQEIERLYYEGLTINEIADLAGVSKSFVSKYLIDNDLRDPRRILSEAECHRLCYLYQSGVPSRRIAERFSITVGAVYAILKRHGIPKKIKPLTTKEREMVIDLWQEEPNIYRIAKQVRRSRGTVLKVVRGNGLYYKRNRLPYHRRPNHVWIANMVRPK